MHLWNLSQRNETECRAYTFIVDRDFEEHPLDSLLDEQTDEEFGDIVIRDQLHHMARESRDGNLKNWTAQDFSSIYVRFHPHLIRHAHRYLSNPAQVEEVVQEAFLYLMTSLPEIDSELGVLKFLKWKVRLLCLDVIRSSTFRLERPLASGQEEGAYLDESSAELERIEDAAIIRLALAKLSPRHREVIVKSVYEEKESEEIAESLGLSRNATRQLLLRARRSFRRALVGEADVKGMSLAEIMSTATRKVAADSKRQLPVAGLLLMMTIGSVSVIGSLQDSPAPVVASAADISKHENLVQETEVQADVIEDNGDLDKASPLAELPSVVPGQNLNLVEPGPVSGLQEATLDLVDNGATSLSTPNLGQSSGPDLAYLSTIVAADIQSTGIYRDSRSALFSDIFTGVSIEVFGGTGISAFLDLDTENMTVRHVIFQVNLGGETYVAVPEFQNVVSSPSGDGAIVRVVTSGHRLVGSDLRVFEGTPLDLAEATIAIELDTEGLPEHATMNLG